MAHWRSAACVAYGGGVLHAWHTVAECCMRGTRWHGGGALNAATQVHLGLGGSPSAGSTRQPKYRRGAGGAMVCRRLLRVTTSAYRLRGMEGGRRVPAPVTEAVGGATLRPPLGKLHVTTRRSHISIFAGGLICWRRRHLEATFREALSDHQRVLTPWHGGAKAPRESLRRPAGFTPAGAGHSTGH